MAMTTSAVYGINRNPVQQPPQTVTTNSTSVENKETPIFSGDSSSSAGYLNVVKFYQGFVDKFLQNEVTLEELRQMNSTIRF